MVMSMQPVGPEMIRCGESEHASQVAHRLGLGSGRPVLIVVGSASNAEPEELGHFRELARATLRPVARDVNSIFMSGGTDAGTMAVLGRELQHCAATTLVGVAPHSLVADPTEPDAGGVPAEPHHDYLVRTAGTEWADAADMLFDIAAELAAPRTPLVLMSGGGQGTRKEYEIALSRGWPVIVLRGTGRQADSVMRLAPGDTQLGISVRDHPSVRRALRWQFSDDDLLKKVWCAAADYDKRACEAKPKFGGLRTVVLTLGVLLVALAVGTGLYVSPGTRLHGTLSVVLAVLPAISAAIMGYISRSSRSGDWVSLRGATNASLREIYLYRASAGRYQPRIAQASADQLSTESHRGSQLSTEWATICRNLASASMDAGSSTEPNHFPPTVSTGFATSEDELITDIDGTDYKAWRATPQLLHLRKAMERDHRKVRRAVLVIYAAAVAGTLLASIDQTIAWIAVSAALATAVAAWLEFDQAEQRTRAMSETTGEVAAAQARWLAVPAADRNSKHEVSTFAMQCEAALAEENYEWERGIRRAHRDFERRPGIT